MKDFLNISFSEYKKQKSNFYEGIFTFISLLIWPLLIFITTYYTYFSFDINLLVDYGINNRTDLLIFLLSGSLVFNSFWSMIQSAIQLSYERESGTLEIIFLSSLNPTKFVYARALTSFVFNSFLFVSFFLIMLIFNRGVNLINLIDIIFSYIILLVASTIWGAFINALFLVSRDNGFLFALFDEPMNFFSGTKIPTASFPSWMKIISVLFPSTYCLNVIRSIFLENRSGNLYSIFEELLPFLLVLLIIVLCTKLLISKAIKNNRKNGNFQFY